MSAESNLTYSVRRSRDIYEWNRHGLSLNVPLFVYRAASSAHVISCQFRLYVGWMERKVRVELTTSDFADHFHTAWFFRILGHDIHHTLFWLIRATSSGQIIPNLLREKVSLSFFLERLMILYQRGPESNFPACRIEHALHISSYYRSRTLQFLQETFFLFTTPKLAILTMYTC